MAAAGDIVDEEQLDHEEINIAVSLSEALQADEVERFLVLYDSIPSIIATERVSFSVNFRVLHFDIYCSCCYANVTVSVQYFVHVEAV